MFLDTPGCPHHDVCAVFEGPDLGPERGAATQGQDLDIGNGTGQTPDFPGHLVRQFPGGAQHQSLDLEAFNLEAFHQPQPEGRGLAGAGFPLSQHILAGQDGRKALSLDGRHSGVPQGGEIIQ